jgi:hypothetical protein
MILPVAGLMADTLIEGQQFTVVSVAAPDAIATLAAASGRTPGWALGKRRGYCNSRKQQQLRWYFGHRAFQFIKDR